MNIFMIGGGGREHALIWKLSQSRKVDKIWCAPGNGGISYDAKCRNIPATDVKAMVADGSLSMGHARALLGVPRLPELQNLAKQVTEKKLSVRDTERLVQQGRSAKGGKDSGKPAPKVSPQVKSLTEELQRRLGTKVRLTEKSPGKGTLEVDFFSYDDLDRLLKLLRKE